MPQLFWLIQNLRSDNQPFTVIFFHHPLYNSGSHGSTLYLRLLWKHVFEHYDIDIVFNGHDHQYERGKVGNVNYVVTGGGRAPLRNVGTSWWTICSEKNVPLLFNYSKSITIKLSGDTTLWKYN